MIKLSLGQADKAGLPPGTPIHIGEIKADSVQISALDYNEDQVDFRPRIEAMECRLLAARPETVTWVNIDGLHQVDILQKVGQCFQLHPLTLEDILNTNQRPKLDIYDDYIYLVLKMPGLNLETGGFWFEQVSFIVSGTQLITFQEKAGDTFDAVRNRIKDGRGRIRKMGTDYLLYVLVDSVVDHYFVMLEKVGEQIEEMEMELVEKPEPSTMRKINFLKREMIMMRKSVWPLREVISSLQRDGVPFIGDSIRFYLKDLYDHTIQVIETVEIYRDMISGMLDIYLSSISNRMNEVMKVLTIYAAIFVPLTLISGIYGMNFNTASSPFNMPELNWYFGYPSALGLMVLIGVIMLVIFKKKGWF
ncbi:MAG: magnesium/cobalt transporter CorA [Proteobacteria bacterium]|nr:magnesium/cobalt transporter CorA [Pseudomonadota bacterium]MBU1686161.1 magnesium/cobalt transporter CorA [Pseudomonadota bacterium]